ncbi:UDP-3-O-(3-hydroxymyristoyl) glucosamine N-acyltransferase [Melioribacter roseus P3M-2]|uniref:UDP-3-O-acylglucosamine N-acyltransferase n=1 Tax=Melioribacter roseus (strain DSM 23840 / JCM 17771 / VKM B-2668 / P3M-2) TaxID=1191523 RepID=I6ZSU7_MELRP|nr:UDP-3-O-(3-hydroxymyristoyl)glucosamine N-acyltransferase [Melioribacter roseus]AFN75114.1 UDP-3-O-(3-hydroxymyristoyl) glucosamine N-acyltransferase [Melioribacter roseus P3M-2]
MKIKLKDAADFVGGIVIGNPDLEISNIAKIEEAGEGDLTFLYLPAYEKYLETTKASAVIISPKFKKSRSDLSYIEIDNPNVAIQKIISTFLKPEIHVQGVDPSASVDNTAILGKNVTLGKNVVISSGCKIGDNSVILHNTVVMENSTVGNNCLIYPNVTIRENTSVGNNVIIHSNSCIGSDGFGYVMNQKHEYEKVPQIGNVVIEDDVEIGSNVSIDRAAIGSTLIRRGVKIDNLVQIAHNVQIGEHTAIAAQAGISGSAKIGKHCMIAGQSGFVGHIEITDGVIIGAQSGVSKSIKTPGKYRGTPAQEMSHQLHMEAHMRNLPKYAEKIKKLEEKIAFLESQISELMKGN